jgi:hypothetical protein
VEEGQLLGRTGVLVALELRKQLLGMGLGAAQHPPDLPHHLGQEFQIPLLRGHHPFPVPLIDIGTVIVIQEIVLAHRLHVGVDALPPLAVESLESHPLPLGGCLDDLRPDRLIETETAREFHRGSGAVSIEVVVDTTRLIDDQRYLHHHQIELFGQTVLDITLDLEESLHGFSRSQ